MSTTNEEKKLIVQNIFKRLIEYYALGSIDALSKFLDVKYSTLKGWERRGNIADIEPFLFKCQNINPQWLKTGQGEMHLNKFQQHAQAIQSGAVNELREDYPHIAVDLPTMTLEQKLKWIGISQKDIRFMLEFSKLSEEEQEEERKRLCIQNIEKGRY